MEYQESGRRRFPRRQLNKKAGVLCLGHYGLGHCHEIGEGGISFVLENPVDLNTDLVVSVQIPRGEFIIVRGLSSNIVQTDQGYLVGVMFYDLSFELKRQIRSYVSQKTEMEERA